MNEPLQWGGTALECYYIEKTCCVSVYMSSVALWSLTHFHRIYPFGKLDMALHKTMCFRLEDGNSPTWGWRIGREESPSDSQVSTEHICIYWSAALWHAGTLDFRFVIVGRENLCHMTKKIFFFGPSLTKWLNDGHENNQQITIDM